MEPTAYTDQFRLDGRTAVVTGALGILGRRFCAGLAAHGAHVAAVDLDEAAAHAFALELAQSRGVRAIGIGCDVSDPASVDAMMGRVLAEFGAVHVLHNNAAGKSDDLNAFFAPFEEYTLEQWRRIMAVNIDGMFLVAQRVGREMVKQGLGGSIIQTASIYGIVAPDHGIYEGSHYLGRTINTPAVYSTSKAAVIGLTRHLSTYWAPHRIRVNTLTPGGVESGQNDTFRKRYSSRVPLGRMAQPDELVGALIYLASDASSYVTGQNLVVDGGLSAW
jgi:NAD(P)-dependent dehydrogenase (short-subunit alcohol dehydrogenase family)